MKTAAAIAGHVHGPGADSSTICDRRQVNHVPAARRMIRNSLCPSSSSISRTLTRREAVPRSLRLWVHIAVAALFANAVPYLLFAVAEQTVNSSTAGIINATTPLWTVVLALAVRHQKAVTRWQAAGLIVGFAGAVLIFSPWRTGSGLTSAGGLECLAASVSYAVSYIYMDRFLARRGLSAIVLSACQLAAAAVMLAIALAVTGARAPDFTTTSVAAVAILGIVGTGIAYVLNYQIITSEGATVASTVTYLLPVVAIVLGVLVLGESVTVTVLAGIALVLAGVALTRRRAASSTLAVTIFSTVSRAHLRRAGPDGQGRAREQARATEGQ